MADGYGRASAYPRLADEGNHGMNSNRDASDSLRLRLHDADLDDELLASEALGIFREAELLDDVRWIGLELRGYDVVTTPESLDRILGVAAGSDLAVAVASYRLQVGTVWEGTSPAGRSTVHFFVESLTEIRTVRARVRAGAVTGQVELEFGPHPGDQTYPRAIEFPIDVFDRVLRGFRKTLERRLGSVP